MAASSPYESAAITVSRPVTSQTTSNQPGEPTCFPMIAETMKMPEPIIEPATSIVESSKPRPLMNPPLRGSAVPEVAVVSKVRRVNHLPAGRRNAKREHFALDEGCAILCDLCLKRLCSKGSSARLSRLFLQFHCRAPLPARCNTKHCR